MNTYRLKIDKYEPNPKYEPIVDSNYNNRYALGILDPNTYTKEILVKSLEVDLTEEEFKAIKKSVVELM